MSENLSIISSRFKKAAAFLDWYEKQWINHPREGRTNPKIEKVHWDLACYYSGVCNVNKGGNRKILSVVKARQTGMSTFNAAYASWLAIHLMNTEILHISQNQRTAALWIEKIKNFVPKQCIKWADKYEIRFSNGSCISARSHTSCGGCGVAVDLLLLDEVAFWEKRTFQEVWASCLPILTCGGRAIITTTPADMKEYPAAKWFTAFMKRWGWFHFTVDKLEDRDQAWVERMRKMYTPEQFQTEVEARFI